ncbi:MAG: beta-lactamase family protein [Dactylosporangium sp.]|nr:beta-lactamase family protein [Dactylosporangium sp.]NNJ59741.1 beta-lactamase family protein [Dactylosporangium sp.]
MRVGAISGTLLAALLVAPLVAAPAAAGTRSFPVDRGGQLQRLLDAEHAAGMPGVFAEVRDGQRTWQGAAGVADIDTGRPTRPWFSHRVGSITKTFVAITVLQLVAEHRIGLDAPIGDYLPEVLPGAPGRQVTVRMLLNHTSGIGNYSDVFDVADLEQLRDQTVTPLELVETGLEMPAVFQPGTGWSYSNTNYIIAGLLIERVTGQPAAAEVGRRILRPLGLRRTYFPGTNPHIRGPHANAYVPWLDGTLRDFSVFNMSWAWMAGAIISTPQDLNRFYRALLSGQILPPALLAEMRDTVPMVPDLPDLLGYGLGLYWEQLPCGPAWGHTGGVIGQTTVSWHSADGSRQVSLGENLSFLDDTEQARAVAEARGQFLVAALCGPEAEVGATAAGADGRTSLAETVVPRSMTRRPPMIAPMVTMRRSQS